MRTLVAEILAAWRRAERLAAELEPGTAAQQAAVTASERLRDLYHDLTRAGVAGTVGEADAQVLLAELATTERRQEAQSPDSP